MLTIFTSEFKLVLVLLTNETQTNMTLVILLFSFSRSFLYVLVLTIDSTHLWQWPVGVIAVLKSGTGLQFTSGNPGHIYLLKNCSFQVIWILKPLPDFWQHQGFSQLGCQFKVVEGLLVVFENCFAVCSDGVQHESKCHQRPAFWFHPCRVVTWYDINNGHAWWWSRWCSLFPIFSCLCTRALWYSSHCVEQKWLISLCFIDFISLGMPLWSCCMVPTMVNFWSMLHSVSETEVKYISI